MTTTISTNNSLSMSGGTVTYTNLGEDSIVSWFRRVCFGWAGAGWHFRSVACFVSFSSLARARSLAEKVELSRHTMYGCVSVYLLTQGTGPDNEGQTNSFWVRQAAFVETCWRYLIRRQQRAQLNAATTDATPRTMLLVGSKGEISWPVTSTS